jgi:hypothetical protein
MIRVLWLPLAVALPVSLAACAQQGGVSQSVSDRNTSQIQNIDKFLGRPVQPVRTELTRLGYQVKVQSSASSAAIPADRRNYRVTLITTNGKVTNIWQG